MVLKEEILEFYNSEQRIKPISGMSLKEYVLRN